MKRLLLLIAAASACAVPSSAAPSASIVTINNAWTDRITEVDGTVWRRGSNFDAAASNLVCFSEVIFAPGLQMDYQWESSTQVHDGSGDWSVSNFDQSEYKHITVIEGVTNETTNGSFDFDSEFPFRTDNRYERAKFSINLSGSFGIPSGGDGDLWIVGDGGLCSGFDGRVTFSRYAEPVVAVKLDGGDTNKLYWVELTVHVYDLGPCPYTEDGNGTEDPPVVEVTPGRKIYKTRVNGNWLQEDNTVRIQCRGDSLTPIRVVKSQELEYWFYFTIGASYIGPVSGIYPSPTTGESQIVGGLESDGEPLIIVAGDTTATVSGDPNSNSGTIGLHVDKDSANPVPVGLSYDIDGAPKWESAIDYGNYDFVIAYTHDNTSPWGTGDVLRVSPNRRFVMGPTVGTPTNYPSTFTVLRANGLAGLNLKAWGGNADVADAIKIERLGDAYPQWLNWTQGNTYNDWRLGMVKNTSSYDLGFYHAGGTASSATSPGTQVMAVTPDKLDLKSSSLRMLPATQDTIDRGIYWINTYGDTNAYIGPDLWYSLNFNSTVGVTVNLDSDNNGSSSKFIVKKDSTIPTGGTQLMEVTEAGDLTVAGSVSATYLSVGGQIFGAALHLDTGSGGTTTLANTYDSTYFVTTTGATVTLPYAIGYPGQIRTVKVISPATSGTVATQGSETIDGSATYSLSAQNKFVTVQSNGANWYIIGQN